MHPGAREIIGQPALVGLAFALVGLCPRLAAAQASPGMEEVPAPMVSAPSVGIEEETADVPGPSIRSQPIAPPVEPPAPPSRQTRRVRVPGSARGLYGLGIPLAAGVYLQTLIVGAGEAASHDKPISPGFYIPVVGPVLIRYSDPTTETFFVLSTVGQATGWALIALAAFWKPMEDREVPVTLAPMLLPGGRGAGLSLGGTW